MLVSSMHFLFCLVGTSLAATTTITNAAASTVPSLPAVPTTKELKNNVSFSAINQPLNIPDLIPAHVNLTCLNCSTTGSISLAAGGYNANDSAMGIAADFFSSGFLKFTAHDLRANISTRIALTPGFQLANLKIPLFQQHLFTLPMGKLGAIDIAFEIFIPVVLQLNSEVDIFPQLTLAVPDNATLYLDFGDRNNSFIAGFNESKLMPSLDLTAPNLAFTMLTGLDYLLTANTTIGNPTSNSAIDFTADFSANLGLPILNTTVTELKHVNATCDPPRGSEQVYESAVGVQHSAHLGLDLNGLLSVQVGNFSEDWAPPAINAFNRTFPLATSCYKFDPVATGLIAATATPGANANASGNGTGSGTASKDGQDKKASGAARRAAVPMVGVGVVGMATFVMALVML